MGKLKDRLNKSVNLFMPVFKAESGAYVAVLSDDSVDGDDEIVGAEVFRQAVKTQDFLPGLVDHENRVESLVCEWRNLKTRKIGDHHSLVAEPHFYNSGPKSKMVKGFLDEGAKLGVSIGAKVTDYKEEEVDGKTRIVYTGLVIREASFTPVQSNYNAMAQRLAKSYNASTVKPIDKNLEGKNMAEEDPKPDPTPAPDPKPGEGEGEGEDKNAAVILELNKTVKDLTDASGKVSETITASLDKAFKAKEEELDKKINDLVDAQVKKGLSEAVENLRKDRNFVLNQLGKGDATPKPTDKNIVIPDNPGAIDFVRAFNPNVQAEEMKGAE